MASFDYFHKQYYQKTNSIALEFAKSDTHLANTLSNDALLEIWEIKGEEFCLNSHSDEVYFFLTNLIRNSYFHLSGREKNNAFYKEGFWESYSNEENPIFFDEKEDYNEVLSRIPKSIKERLTNLSKQELKVFRLILVGYDQSQIQKVLKINKLSYRVILSNIKSKLSIDYHIEGNKVYQSNKRESPEEETEVNELFELLENIVQENSTVDSIELIKKSSYDSKINETELEYESESIFPVNLVQFQDKPIRRYWHKEEWFFVVEDVIGVLTDSKNTKAYTNTLFSKEKQLKTVVDYLFIPNDTNGKFKRTRCANTEGVLRITMSVPSPKAEPLKQWMAQVGKERIEETENPELGLERLKEIYESKGYTKGWINDRIEELRGKMLRYKLYNLIVDTSNNHFSLEIIKIETLKNWTSKYNPEHLCLASLAAFPLHITADLLYKIWQNFKNTEGGIEIPRVAVSDLLLSGLLQEVSTELFEYPPDLRRSLLQALQQYYSPRDILKDMGEFMLDYLATHYAEGVAYTEPIREAEEWNALAYYDPAKANAKLEAVLNPSAAKNYQTRQLRAVMLTEKLEGQAALRTLDASEKTDFERVLTISKGIKPYIQGDFGKAYEQLQLLPDFKISPENVGNTEGVATLEIPKAVMPVPKIEEKIEERKPTLFTFICNDNEVSAWSSQQLWQYVEVNLSDTFSHIGSIESMPFEKAADSISEKFQEGLIRDKDFVLVLYSRYKTPFDTQMFEGKKGIFKNIIIISDAPMPSTISFKENFEGIWFQSCSINEEPLEVLTGKQFFGLFTKKFLEVLENAEKPLKYTEVFSRVYTKIAQQTDKQHPQIQAFGEANLQDLFLNGLLKPRNTEGVSLPKMKVGFSATVNDDFKKRFKEAFEKEGKSLFFDMSTDADNCDYTIHYDNKQETYTLQTSMGDAVMFPPIRGDYYEIIAFCNNIDSVANWQYTLDLNGNPNATIDHDAIKVQFTNLGADKKQALEADWRQPITLILEENKETYFSLSVKNEGKQALFISMVYLGKDFGVTNDFFKLKKVDSGEISCFEKDGHKEIRLRIQNEFLKQGKTSITEYIKVFVSTEPFQTEDLNREALRNEMRSMSRDIGSRSELQSRDWEQRNIAVKTVVMTLKLKETELKETEQPELEPEMVFVKGGTFKMGSNDYDDEKPIHDVTLSDFNIGKYPITQKQWTAIMGTHPSHFKGDNLPVENVSWDDIQGFLSEINKKTGKTYRLPTEAEWEFAARGGTQSKGFKYAGSDDIKKAAWYSTNSESKTHPVGEKQANELGIYDMSGNVWEWCSDLFDKDYYKNSPSQNPKGAQSGSFRVLRGGSWGNYAYYCRSSLRSRSESINRAGTDGFRLARD